MIASYKRYSSVSNATEKYSDNLASYWISIYCSLKNKQFELISSKYKGPSISTVTRWLSNKNIPKIEDFENIDNLENILSFWYKLYHQKTPNLINHTEITTVNLSIDATKIKEMFKIKNNQYIGVMEEGKRIVDNFDFRYKFEPSKYQELVSRLVSNNYLYSHCFVFLFCPFKMVKPFPIHISFTNNGFASEDIIRKIQAIQSFRNSNFKVISTSTDADVKYDSMQNDFYKKWKAMLDNNVQIHTHEKIMMYPNDGAHILKRIRTHLVKNGIIFLLRNQNNQSISKADFDKLSNDIPKSVWTQTTLASMDDFYPYQLYRADILHKAYSENMYHMMIYLMPCVAVNIIIRSKTINRKQAQILAYTSLFVLLNYIDILEMKNDALKRGKDIISKSPKLNKLYEETKKTEKFVGYFNMKHCIHLANYLYSIIKVLELEEHDFSASKIGTICSEYFFGQLKNESQDQLYSSIRNSFMRKIIQRVYKPEGKEKKINRRWFSTSEFPEGKSILNITTIKMCIGVANLLYSNCGISLSGKNQYQLLKIKTNDDIVEILAYFHDDIKEKTTKKDISYISNSRGANIQKNYITSQKNKEEVLNQFHYKKFELACCATSQDLPKMANNKMLNSTIRFINQNIPNSEMPGNFGIHNFSGHVC